MLLDVVFVVWLADVDQFPAGKLSRSGISAGVAYAADARRPRPGTLCGSQRRRPLVKDTRDRLAAPLAVARRR